MEWRSDASAEGFSRKSHLRETRGFGQRRGANQVGVEAEGRAGTGEIRRIPKCLPNGIYLHRIPGVASRIGWPSAGAESGGTEMGSPTARSSARSHGRAHTLAHMQAHTHSLARVVDDACDNR